MNIQQKLFTLRSRSHGSDILYHDIALATLRFTCDRKWYTTRQSGESSRACNVLSSVDALYTLRPCYSIPSLAIVLDTLLLARPALRIDATAEVTRAIPRRSYPSCRVFQARLFIHDSKWTLSRHRMMVIKIKV